MIASEKQRLREDSKQSVLAMGELERTSASSRLRTMLRENPGWRSAPRIFAFHPLPLEPDLLSACHPEQELYLPRIHGQTLGFHRTQDLSLLEKGIYGIRLPLEKWPEGIPDTGDIVLVPGLAFTESGERLGRGGGFYDRFLEGIQNAACWGVCFRCQIVDQLPMEPHDQKVDRVFSA